MKVRCKNSYLDEDCNENEYCAMECGWTGPLSEWSLHAAKECPVEIVECVCGHRCPRGQMGGHLGSRRCVEMAVEKRAEPIQGRLDEALQRERVYRLKIEALATERDEMANKLEEEAEQNRMLIEQNTWLRHSKESAKKASLNKIQRLKREKKELMNQLAAAEGRVKNLDRGKKRKRSGSKDGRVRTISNGNELEVHAIVG